MTPEPYPTPWRWVDLGLPSGTLWLDRNIGANSPEDVGLYFMWGQLTGFNEPPGLNLSEYYSQLGLNSISADLSLENDAAAYYYGNKFRMPTADEYRELIQYTTVTKVNNNFKFTSNVNGASILIPASGAMADNEILSPAVGRAWTKTYHDANYAYSLAAISSGGVGYAIHRYNGLPIRPVYNR